MNIYLTDVENGADFCFPANPEEIACTFDSVYQTYNIISLGEVVVPKGRKAARFSWDGYFWGTPRRRQPFIVGTWKKPDGCIEILDRWRKKERILRLMVTETPINIDVTISKFVYKPFGGLDDYKYSIQFTEYRELKMYTTAEMGVTSYEKKTTPRVDASSQSAGTAYTIQDDDTLWGIARKFYGDGMKWEVLYEANAEVIERDAREKLGFSSSNRGWWIGAGTQIIIP